MIELVFAAIITASSLLTPAPAYIAQEPTYSGGEIVEQGYVESMDAQRLTYLMDALERLSAEEQSARKAWQIDDYLRGSPMAGLGAYIVQRCEAYSINPYLVPAVAEAESSCGRACLAAHNFAGMIGAGGFASWQAAIDYWCEMVNTHWPGAQSAYEMRGYCVPDHPWMENVQRVADAIGQRQGFGGGGSSAE